MKRIVKRLALELLAFFNSSFRAFAIVLMYIVGGIMFAYAGQKIWELVVWATS